MNLIENMRIALEGLFTNRLRAALTMLGIIIGVGAVIGLVSLGGGVQNFISGQFEGLGSNILFVFSSRPASGTRTTIQPISTREGEALGTRMVAPSIAQVAMEYDVPAVVAAGSRSVVLPVSGITPNYTEVRNWNVRDEGAFISDNDVDGAARVAVVGTTVVDRLFGDKSLNPIGQTVRINDRVFTIIGVMEEKASGFFGDENLVVFIPLTTAQTRLDRVRTRDGGYEVSVLYIQARDKEAMESATLEIETYLNDTHNIAFQGEQDFTIINQANLLSSLGAITGILTIFLGLIAGISLLVGGIGIMNIMLVSVTERTREIGLRKAVGARASDILTQFLIESLVLSIVGGGLGVLFGVFLTVLASFIIHQLGSDIQLSVTGSSIMLATFVSGFIGIFFGLYPAQRAARMRPIDALRFE
ncbi:MAG: ABC transporter permease [Anaerolineae bacterium]